MLQNTHNPFLYSIKIDQKTVKNISIKVSGSKSQKFDRVATSMMVYGGSNLLNSDGRWRCRKNEKFSDYKMAKMVGWNVREEEESGEWKISVSESMPYNSVWMSEYDEEELKKKIEDDDIYYDDGYEDEPAENDASFSESVVKSLQHKRHLNHSHSILHCSLHVSENGKIYLIILIFILF